MRTVYIPDGTDEKEALARTTHLAIAAHEDDIEFMAYAPIAECFGRQDKWFCGVVVTDGAGSPRSGIYADYTDEDMKKIRIEEQKKASNVGNYGAQILLGYSSKKAYIENKPLRTIARELGIQLYAVQKHIAGIQKKFLKKFFENGGQK